MNLRDSEFIDNRLSDPGPAVEAIDRLRKTGNDDLADQVMVVARTYLDNLREIRHEFRSRQFQ